VKDVDLEITKSQVLASTYSALNSIEGKSGMLGHYAMMRGNGYNLQDDIDRYNAVTKEDVLRVYRKYIKGRYAVILRVEKDPTKKMKMTRLLKSVNPHANEDKNRKSISRISIYFSKR